MESSQSPLAVALLKLEGVTGVFLGTDFITISKVRVHRTSYSAAFWPHVRTVSESTPPLPVRRSVLAAEQQYQHPLAISGSGSGRAGMKNVMPGVLFFPSFVISKMATCTLLKRKQGRQAAVPRWELLHSYGMMMMMMMMMMMPDTALKSKHTDRSMGYHEPSLCFDGIGSRRRT